MRLERLDINKFKAFLTFDDMNERGITKEDLWQDVPKVHDLFRDMMLEADDELGFKIDGPIAVEVFAMPAQGMVIIVTKGAVDDDFDLDAFEEGYIEMQVTLDESEDILFEFYDLEDVIQLAERLYAFGVIGGSFYSFENRYFLKFEEFDIEQLKEEAFISLLSEYGNSSTASIYRIKEYGKEIIEFEAIYKLYQSFVQK
ncbi:adaptor protein [Alkalihalobacillus alcalophilus ATCC 27647 = CGMCC 1.3604]|uniref:Adapter protein MecA n=1 Tax=Alkalihalobacillus alcalophilus ATCC 27647 = CGMCC 1.3604 TaxID=1218173 RepID=A0A094WQW0_ALKAL|nr:genetic competence negative regulator [Alkalihalobacillus alcalophilus]KGA99176.1 adaptor protein [Alkalihalobacillus alcalophilus ATCC 27647 = CGMCC 1.3604]MED1561281.1 genetic competence negative regulator [Alkalihalobacillus alcalophilus]THG90090.1 adaptor protein [Alkalihalobacillus alcalophilus ATCC 27647 = CGMCC 1.3604]